MSSLYFSSLIYFVLCILYFCFVLKDGVQELLMYVWSRIDEGFRDEVDKFIEAAEKHALTLTHYKGWMLFQPPLEILFVRGWMVFLRTADNTSRPYK